MSVTIFQIDLALTAREKEIEGEKKNGGKNSMATKDDLYFFKKCCSIQYFFKL